MAYSSLQNDGKVVVAWRPREGSERDECSESRNNIGRTLLECLGVPFTLCEVKVCQELSCDVFSWLEFDVV